jgi:hypothetical protein
MGLDREKAHSFKDFAQACFCLELRHSLVYQFDRITLEGGIR